MELIINDQKQMINYLHKQAEDHVKTRNILIEMNEELEKEINQKDEEIMRLKRQQKETKLNESNEVCKLLEEIEVLKNLNKEKENILTDVVRENRILQQNLSHLKEETKTLKEDIAKNEFETNLSDELGIVDPRAHNVSPSFQQSNFENYDSNKHGTTLMKKIWKLKHLQLEKTINAQKLKLTADLLQLKEKEMSRSLNCDCKTYCRITHTKHNWKKSMSDEVFLKYKLLDKAYSCKNCDKTFENVDCIKWHIKTFHEEGEIRNTQVKLQGGDC